MFFFNVIFVGCEKISGELISNVRREEHALTMCHECITNVLNTIYKYNFRLLFYPTLEIADIIKQNKEKTEETLYISKTILRTFPSLSKFQIDFTAG